MNTCVRELTGSVLSFPLSARSLYALSYGEEKVYAIESGPSAYSFFFCASAQWHRRAQRGMLPPVVLNTHSDDLDLNLTVLKTNVGNLRDQRRRPAISAVTFKGIVRLEGFFRAWLHCSCISKATLHISLDHFPCSERKYKRFHRFLKCHVRSCNTVAVVLAEMICRPSLNIIRERENMLSRQRPETRYMCLVTGQDHIKIAAKMLSTLNPVNLKMIFRAILISITV